MTKEELEAKINTGAWSEGLHVDFKEDCQYDKEFYKDVTAFANSEGGEIIIGIREVNGTSHSVIGVKVDDPEKLKIAILQGIQSNITPRLLGVDIEFIHGFDDERIVVIVRVQPSRLAPHLPDHNGHTNFCIRHGSYNPRMSIEELRLMILNRESPAQKFERFIAERVVVHLNNEELVNMQPDWPRWIVQVAGLGGLIRSLSLEWSQISQLREHFSIINSGVDDSYATIDGFIRICRANDGYSHSFVLLSREGFLETSTVDLFGSEGVNIDTHMPIYRIGAKYAMQRTADWASSALKLLIGLQIEPPYFLTVTIVKGQSVSLYEASSSTGNARAFGRNVVRLPILEIPGDIGDSRAIFEAMRPIADFLFQVGGIFRCPWFDDEGTCRLWTHT